MKNDLQNFRPCPEAGSHFIKAHSCTRPAQTNETLIFNS